MSISSLPNYLFVTICLYSEPEELCSLSETCKKFHSIIFPDFSPQQNRNYGKQIWESHAVKNLKEIDGDIPFLKILGAKVCFSAEIFISSATIFDFIKFANLWKSYCQSGFLFAERNQAMKTKKKNLKMIHLWIHEKNLSLMEGLEKDKKPLNLLQENKHEKFIDYYKGSAIPHLWFKVKKNYFTPLLMVAGDPFSDNVKCVKYLVNKEKVNINSGNHTTNPLMRACSGSNTKVVKFLLKQKKIEVNAKSKYNWNALSTSILNNRQKIFDLLLKHDKINTNTSLGEHKVNSPLIVAMMNKNIEFFKRLASHKKTDIHYKTEGGNDCVNYAFENNLIEYLKILFVRNQQDLLTKK